MRTSVSGLSWIARREGRALREYRPRCEQRRTCPRRTCDWPTRCARAGTGAARFRRVSGSRKAKPGIPEAWWEVHSRLSSSAGSSRRSSGSRRHAGSTRRAGNGRSSPYKPNKRSRSERRFPPASFPLSCLECDGTLPYTPHTFVVHDLHPSTDRISSLSSSRLVTRRFTLSKPRAPFRRWK